MGTNLGRGWPLRRWYLNTQLKRTQIDIGKPRAKVLKQRKYQGGKTLRGRMSLVKSRKGKASVSKW